jgi:hypothetical protein
MQLKIRKPLGSLGLLAFASVLLISLAQPMNAREPSGERGKLIGTWFTTVTLRDCGSNQELGVFPSLFPSLGTFASGGTLTDTTTGFSPALRSPGHGTWEQTGRNKYSSISLAFLFSPAGEWTGTQRITQDIEIKNNRFTSTAAVRFFDTAGNLTRKGCATATASRVEPVEEDDDPLTPSQDQ